MSHRTFDEFTSDFVKARSQRDMDSLHVLQQELNNVHDTDFHLLKLMLAATIQMMTGHSEEALELLLKLVDESENGNDKSYYKRAIGDIGIVYWETGRYTSSLEYFHKALALNEADGSVEGMGAMTNNIGLIFNDTGDYPTSLEYYRKALAMHIEAGNQQNVANTTGNIGGILAESGDIQAGMEYYLRAFALQSDLENIGAAAGLAATLANACLDLDQPNEAAAWMERAVGMVKESNDNRSVAGVASSHATYYLKKKEFEKALAVLDEFTDVFSSYASMVTQTTATRAAACRELGNRSEARRLFEEALEQATGRNERKAMAEIHKDLRDLAKEDGDFDAYIRHNELHLSIANEVSGADSARRMAMQEKEREIEGERKQRDREREILYGALPKHVADRLIKGQDVSDSFASASVLFLDIAGFTRIASMVPPGHVVHLLESIFSVCDEVVQKHGLTKVKTIGDSYMAVSGVPDVQSDHVDRMARAATEIQDELTRLQLTMPPALGDTSWVNNIGEVHARVGIHCGPVVAGVVGKERLQYDVWGDAVNIASRMESSGEPGRVQASQDFINNLSDQSEWDIESRVAFEIKGKGVMQTYWLAQRP